MSTIYGAVATPVSRLIEEFNRLPGIGPKSAQRLTYYLLRAPEAQARSLAEAILDIKQKISLCSICFNITEHDPCAICADDERDRSVICVVEEPLDILAIERIREFRGLYHVLHGVISPMDGVGPENLRIKELLSRLGSGGVHEVILATNPSLEGDATANYIYHLVAPLGVRVTRIARGLPAGGDLDYADDLTLKRALVGRQAIA